MNGPLSWVERFVQWGQCVAFMDDSSLGSSGHTWEKQNGVQSHVCPEGIGGCTMGAGRGRRGEGGFISPGTKESTQLALGRVEQLKGCEKIKGAIVVTRPFHFEKALRSALNAPLELRGAVPVSPHLLETGLVDFLFLSDVSRTLEPVQRLVQ